MYENEVIKADAGEAETVIQFSRNGDKVSVWTSDNTVFTKMKKLVNGDWEWGKETRRGGQLTGVEIVGDKGLVTLRSGKRDMSDEQKEKFRERMKKMREG